VFLYLLAESYLIVVWTIRHALGWLTIRIGKVQIFACPQESNIINISSTKDSTGWRLSKNMVQDGLWMAHHILDV